MSSAKRADSASKSSPRRYDSTLRRRQAEQNRQSILDAAATLFGTRGWSVAVREIADAAGTSVETIYTHFGSKSGLLLQVLDVGIVGDDEPVPLADRAEYASMSQGSHGERASAAAALITSVNRRIAGISRALLEASQLDPELAAHLETSRERQRSEVRSGGELVAGRKLTSVEAEGLWALLGHEVYELLTGSAGWSPEKYEKWIAEVITRQLSLEG